MSDLTMREAVNLLMIDMLVNYDTTGIGLPRAIGVPITIMGGDPLPVIRAAEGIVAELNERRGELDEFFKAYLNREDEEEQDEYTE